MWGELNSLIQILYAPADFSSRSKVTVACNYPDHYAAIGFQPTSTDFCASFNNGLESPSRTCGGAIPFKATENKNCVPTREFEKTDYSNFI